MAALASHLTLPLFFTLIPSLCQRGDHFFLDVKIAQLNSERPLHQTAVPPPPGTFPKVTRIW